MAASLPGVPPGAYSSVDVYNSRLLLGGDSVTYGADEWQPSYVFQLPATLSINSGLALIWTQPSLTPEARACTFGNNGSVILAGVRQAVQVYSGASLETCVSYFPLGIGDGNAITFPSVACNKTTGSIACGARVFWGLIQEEPFPQACTTTDGPFAKSVYFRKQMSYSAGLFPTTSLLETNMQAVGIFIGPVVTSEDIVVVGSSDNTALSSARSFPLLFLNGDPSKAKRLTDTPIAARSVAVADISGNGLPDIFIVGTEGFHYLLLQGPRGSFTEQKIPIVEGDVYGHGVVTGRIFSSADTYEVVISSLDPSNVYKNTVLSFLQPRVRPIPVCDGPDVYFRRK